MVEVLAQNKDRALRYEQTYNILNFDNKLKGLENRPDYPKEKPWYYRPGKDTIVNYNIISNIDMKDHHFQPPEKRPEPTEQEVSKHRYYLNHSLTVINCSIENKRQGDQDGAPERLQRHLQSILRTPRR